MIQELEKEPIKRYSQAFKQMIVREYEAGTSVYALLNKYGIGGHKTVKRWIKQYGRSGFRAEVVVIQTAEDQLLLELVQGLRQRHPRMGGRKLFHELRQPMTALGITRGRDAFFDLLRAHNLLVKPKRNRRRTTRSGLWRCPNRLTDLTITRVNQVWVADITYILTEEGYVYLALITDAFSRYIVGFDLSSSLAAEGCQRALQQAIATADRTDLTGLIHHSDHGVQYTAWPYREQLQAAGILSSMGEVGNCYENALAERMNGILKCEYGLDDLFANKRLALLATIEAIRLYNTERPHMSLGYCKPAEIYFGK